MTSAGRSRILHELKSATRSKSSQHGGSLLPDFSLASRRDEHEDRRADEKREEQDDAGGRAHVRHIVRRATANASSRAMVASVTILPITNDSGK